MGMKRDASVVEDQGRPLDQIGGPRETLGPGWIEISPLQGFFLCCGGW